MKELKLEVSEDAYQKALTVFFQGEKIRKLYAPVYKRHVSKLKRLETKDSLITYLNSLEAKLLKNYTLYLLSKASQSEKQLKYKLKSRYFSDEAIENVMLFLKQNDLIDDRSLMESKIHSLLCKGYGENYIFQKLSLDFQIDNKEFSEIFFQLSDEKFTEEKLVRLIEKRKKSGDYKERQKSYLFLRRKGHSHETAEKVLKKVY